MPNLSIVVAYHNRNIACVERFLASIDARAYRDFELIFVDYGSDEIYAGAVENITHKYSWCKHVYNDTRGMLWNKSHTINSGVRLTNGEYFLSTDIDLIYSKDVLQNDMHLADLGKQLFSVAFMLPETFTQFETLERHRPVDFEESPYQSIGMFHLLSNEVFQDRLTGLDEFYCIWGKEDIDGYVRGRNAGLESYWLDNRNYPLYHHWHPTTTASQRQYVQWWCEDLVIHFEMKREEVSRNQEPWGRLLKDEDRKTIHDTPHTQMDLPKGMNPYSRSRAMADSIHFLKYNQGRVLLIKLPREPMKIDLSGRKFIHSIGFRGVRALNKAFDVLNIDLEVGSKSGSRLMSSEDSMLYFLFNLIVKHSLIKDYNYSEEEKYHVYKLSS